MSESFVKEDREVTFTQAISDCNDTRANIYDKIENESVNIKREIELNEKPVQGRDEESNEDPVKIEDIEINIKDDIELYEEPILFTRERYNIKHQVTHMHQSPYQCSICYKAFTLEYHLVSH